MVGSTTSGVREAGNRQPVVRTLWFAREIRRAICEASESRVNPPRASLTNSASDLITPLETPAVIAVGDMERTIALPKSQTGELYVTVRYITSSGAVEQMN